MPIAKKKKIMKSLMDEAKKKGKVSDKKKKDIESEAYAIMATQDKKKKSKK